MSTKKTETVRFFHLPDMPYVRAVYGANVQNEFPRHAHEGFSVGIVLDGTRLIGQGGASTAIPKGRLFGINPETAHTCSSPGEGHSYFILSIDAGSLQAMASQTGETGGTIPYFPHVRLDDEEAASAMRRFLTLLENGSPALERESVALPLLSTLIRRHGGNPPPPRRASSHAAAVRRTSQFIRAHYAEDLSLAQLSREACLSPFHFHRLFLESMGVSPHDYLVQFRIRKARELLADGQSIAQAALDTGFFDQSHFTRHFRRIVGITPGSYLRTGKTGRPEKDRP